MSWGDKITVKKGDFAEDIVASYLLQKGLIPYKPHFDGAHPFDFLCATTNKKNMVIADAKAKAPFNYQFKNAHRTGIDTTHYEQYGLLGKKYNMNVWLFFIDEELEYMYGNRLKDLDKQAITKDVGGSKRLFRLYDMKVVSKLSDDQVEFLKANSTRRHPYINTKEKLRQLLKATA